MEVTVEKKSTGGSEAGPEVAASEISAAPGISIMQRAHPASPGGRAGRRLWWFRSLNIPGSTSFPDSSVGKKICLQCGRSGFDPWVGKILWRRQWHPTPVLLPGKSHGRRSLVGYSPWGPKESNMTEQLHF